MSLDYFIVHLLSHTYIPSVEVGCGVLDPLTEELCCDWLRAIGKVSLLKKLQHQGCVVE